MLARPVKAFSAKKAQNSLVVINGALAMGTNIFAHGSILLPSRQMCQVVKSFQKIE